MSRFIEFFEGDNSRLSMTRLTIFLSLFPATYILIVNAKEMTIENLLGWYLSAYVLGYASGKFADAMGGKSNANSVVTEELEVNSRISRSDRGVRKRVS